MISEKKKTAAVCFIFKIKIKSRSIVESAKTQCEVVIHLKPAGMNVSKKNSKSFPDHSKMNIS